MEKVLLSLSESLMEDPSWVSFLKEMEDYLECDNCALFFRQPTEVDAGVLISQDQGMAKSSEVAGLFQNSPFFNMPEGQINVLSRMIKAVDIRDNHKRYLEYHRGKGTIDIMALNLIDPTTGLSCNFRLVRYAGSQPFGERGVAKLGQLIPHLRAALSTHSRLVQLQQQIYITDKTTSTAGIGFIVLRSDALILKANSAAGIMLQNNQDFSILNGRLSCVDKVVNRELLRNLSLFMNDDVEQEDCTLEIPCSQNDNEKWLLMMRRFELPQAYRGESDYLVSLVIRNSGHTSRLAPEDLVKIFGLTPAQALLAEGLVLGESLTEVAERLGRTRGTVRSQLAAMFVKTGVHKQHQLISHIMHTASKYWL